MSHNDNIKFNENNSENSENKIKLLSKSTNESYSSFRIDNKIGLLFHPEVTHTDKGLYILNNFLEICKCNYEWTFKNVISEGIKEIKNKVKDSHVIMAVSGGVDSTVAATIIHKAIGKQLHCVFINNGCLRLNEPKEVMDSFKTIGLNVMYLDHSTLFLNKLKGVYDPEQKRKIIGSQFIDSFKMFKEHLFVSKDLKINWLGQGTIYSDVIESSFGDRKIKSHHNVGGLPENLSYKLLEPLKNLFKDEVRQLGEELNIPSKLLQRHPFPGPGLSIRIMGKVNKKKVIMLQMADNIFINILKQNDLYNCIWQAGAILLSTKTVGVMGDKRTYQYTIALRAVCSEDGMTASIYPIPYPILKKISTSIINKVKGVNRVVYDISSKPPSTIEWQ